MDLESHRLPCFRIPSKLHFRKSPLTDCPSHLIFTHSTLDFGGFMLDYLISRHDYRIRSSYANQTCN
ncbi:hypothetical protein HanRHA438_Chr14g0642831 [Helianthus annuus]|nr:hypothetical protein HanRHA438_Chr14g0642831 [Helianthus annuus]